jgi:hypothetical protein
VSDVTNKGVGKCRAPRLRYWGTTDAIDNVHVIGGSIMTARRSGNRLAALTGNTAIFGYRPQRVVDPPPAGAAEH